jgi:hypothetical protein
VLAAKLVGEPLQVTVPVYWSVSVIAVTGVAPATGAVTPAIADRLTIVSVGGVIGVGQPSNTMAVSANINGNSAFVFILNSPCYLVCTL